MRRHLSLLLACSSWFCACQGAPESPMPDGGGKGLTGADAEPPAGATTWARPEWHVGDRFVLVRGEVAKAEFAVIAVDADTYTLRGPGNLRSRRDLDLGYLGDWEAERDEPVHLLSPVDVRFHWPLWVGKRWSCEFVDRVRGRPAMPTQATYLVEALDTVTVPAGTFEALRIVRTLRLQSPDERFLTRTQIIWYAPSIGTEVRQVIADTAVELVAIARDQ
ncbi:MAG TPA: hypothetical protein VFZ65_01765 [Planctomycetota bacterium]|nr:hypothetical protein [Planctomycetota bacterium]